MCYGLNMTPEQEASAVWIAGCVAELVRGLGSVPSGELYARLCGKMDLQTYTALIGALKRAKLVAESNHALSWIGPKLEDK